MLENIVQTDKLLPLGITKIMQLKELYSFGKENLSRHSIETPGLEAYLLLSESAVIDDLSEVYVNPDKEIDLQKFNRFQELLERRIKREPIAYILGGKEFYSKPYKVNPSVLIPRPETELLVDETLNLVQQRTSPLILEIGTGSGCISVTIASLCENVEIVASDISREALAVAKQNITKHNQKDRISLLRGDLLDSFEEQSFDIIVSNPPYITEAEFDGLESEVKDFEPQIALTAGQDGLYYIRKIISDSTKILKDGGWCILEIGHNQKESVQNIFRNCGFTKISSIKDLNGIERVIKAKWKK
ncbi:MAG: release factor glutamine methyltransferase [Thermodesulfobacteriota bacterium]|nr:MAG: release factor glutamine methyltransferase [Thermodesulfobacteriota bacterium]